jgi:hypothetical protein
MIQKIDPTDERRNLKLLFLVMMSSKTQNYFLSLPNIFTFELTINSSVMAMLEYIASFHYFLANLINNKNL